MKRAVFLDRDGVLNRSLVRNGQPSAPLTVNDLDIFPEAPAALQALKQADYLLICVTNQPEVVRGALAPEALEEIHSELRRALPLDAIYVCPHDDRDNCACRKPKPGMLLNAARDFDIAFDRSFLIGDRWRDVDAAHAAGCRAIFIDYGYREREPSRPPEFVAHDIRGAVRFVLAQERVPS